MNTLEFYRAVASTIRSENKNKLLAIYADYRNSDQLSVDGQEKETVSELEDLLTSETLTESKDHQRFLLWYYLKYLVHPSAWPKSAPQPEDGKTVSFDLYDGENPPFLAIVAANGRIVGILPHSRYKSYILNIIEQYFRWFYNGAITINECDLEGQDSHELKLQVNKKNGLSFVETFSFRIIDYLGYQDTNLYGGVPF